MRERRAGGIPNNPSKMRIRRNFGWQERKGAKGKRRVEGRRTGAKEIIACNSGGRGGGWKRMGELKRVDGEEKGEGLGGASQGENPSIPQLLEEKDSLSRVRPT